MCHCANFETQIEEEKVEIKIKLLDGGKMPTKATEGAAAFDCYAREDMILVCGIARAVPLGFALELPEGYCAKILARSGMTRNTNVRMANGIGLIDSDYRGEVGALYECSPVYSPMDKRFVTRGYSVRAGDRIAQMLIERVENVELVGVAELSETKRGKGGYGSTGR